MLTVVSSTFLIRGVQLRVCSRVHMEHENAPVLLENVQKLHISHSVVGHSVDDAATVEMSLESGSQRAVLCLSGLLYEKGFCVDSLCGKGIQWGD